MFLSVSRNASGTYIAEYKTDAKGLGITEAEIKTAKTDGYIKYLRILGFRRDSSELMKEFKNNARLPVITKTADNKELMKDEIYYSGIYYALTGAESEYERSPVIV